MFIGCTCSWSPSKHPSSSTNYARHDTSQVFNSNAISSTKCPRRVVRLALLDAITVAARLEAEDTTEEAAGDSTEEATETGNDAIEETTPDAEERTEERLE